MRISLTAAIAALAACLFAGLTLPAAAKDTRAKHAIIMDLGTGDVLMSKDPDVPVPPASMSKLMTIYMVFERLKDGRLKLSDKFKVSEKAWRKGGSKMFVPRQFDGNGRGSAPRHHHPVGQ